LPLASNCTPYPAPPLPENVPPKKLPVCFSPNVLGTSWPVSLFPYVVYVCSGTMVEPLSPLNSSCAGIVFVIFPNWLILVTPILAKISAMSVALACAEPLPSPVHLEVKFWPRI
jgi:hypothetical protein